MPIGIYSIINKINGNRYIGSSCNTDVRFYKHKWKLINGKHENPHLQNAWNKYGECSFEFKIIEECLIDSLLLREQFYLTEARTNRESYYNNNFIASKPPSQLGLKRSVESIKNISNANQGKNMGRFPKNSTKQKMSDSHSKKYIFISPENVMIFIINLKKFCIDNGLNEGGMHSVLSGRYNHHKGWKVPSK